MLACARIGAPHNVVFGGFSAEAVRERMEFSEAKVLITVDGAARKGKTGAGQGPRGRGDGRPARRSRRSSWCRSKGTPCQMSEGRDVFYDEILAAADAECPAEPLDAEHPLFILYTSGSTAKPKGILHTTGGYLTGVAATHRYVFDLKPESDVYWCAADVGWVTGHSYIVYGPLVQRRHVGDVGGRARLPGQGHLVGARRALRRHDPLLRPDRDPRVHQVGGGVAEQARPLIAAPARLGRRADQPEGLALVPQGDRRRALPDRGHVVADRDGRDHDHAAAGHHRHQARLGDAALPGRVRGGARRVHRRAGQRRVRACSCSPVRGRRCCARSTRRRSASSRPTSRASARRPTSSATPPGATATATSG